MSIADGLSSTFFSRVAAHFGKDPREYSISTKEFVSDGNGKIKGVNTVRVAWEKDALGQWRMSEVPGSEQFFPADLYVLSRVHSASSDF
jgi:glutamate synthase (NADPH/NADH)